MKANDIQIGDWLYSIIDRYDHVEKKLCKVTGVRTDSDTPLIQCDDTDVWYPLDSYESVPLTAEILEKNGIKWLCTEPSGRKTYYCNDPVVQCTYIPDSGWLINAGVCGRIKVRFVEISKVQYVLELQHALRLCKIEKTIEL